MIAGAEALFTAVLAEQASRPLVTFYDDATGERVELSARSLANWVAKTHFLLTDELGLGVGDTAVIGLAADWITVPILLGCWSAGLALTTDTPGEVAFVTPASDPVDAGDVFAVNPASMTRSFAAAAPIGTDYVSAVRPQADAWASVRPAATGGDLALADGTTRAQLQQAAIDRGAERGWAAGARVLCERPWTGPADWIDALLAPLAVIGSVVLVANAEPARRDRRIEQEQVTAVL